MNKNYQLITSLGYEIQCYSRSSTFVEIAPKDHFFFDCEEVKQGKASRLSLFDCDCGQEYIYKDGNYFCGNREHHLIQLKATHAIEGSPLDKIMADALQTIPRLRALREAAEIAAALPPTTNKAPSVKRGRL